MNKDQLKKLEADLWSAADKLRCLLLGLSGQRSFCPDWSALNF
jgi:hypothetical protein